MRKLSWEISAKEAPIKNGWDGMRFRTLKYLLTAWQKDDTINAGFIVALPFGSVERS